jgi:hypothetical protein
MHRHLRVRRRPPAPVAKTTPQPRSRRTLAGLSFGALLGVFLTVIGVTSAAAVTVPVQRIYGTDAIGTSIAASQAEFPAAGSAKVVVLARSDFFADALAGGPLAAKLGGPLLITPGASQSATLDPRVLAEIQRVLPVGGTVDILGGELAISPGVAEELMSIGYNVMREGGVDEYATAVDIAEALGNPTTIFEATGLNFQDALSAVPAAIEDHGAILLTDGTAQAPETAAYLAANPGDTRYAIGGPLAAYGADPTAIPVYGQDLYGTSAAVATTFFPSATAFGAATGADFPDALSGGVFMGEPGTQGPMLLVQPSGPLPSAVANYLSGVASTLTQGYLFGGPLAVGAGALLELGTPNPTGLPVGPGPQATYTVQPQPAPGSCQYTYIGLDPLPDPNCTPGAISPAVTQANIGSTICQSGYTSTIRPPEAITDTEKQASALAYSYTGSFATAEYDHLVPLELGGDPNDPANLWVEPNDIPGATTTANTKDVLEDALNGLVCSGQLSLAVAQVAIASNWVTAYQTYVGALPSPTSPTTPASTPPPSSGAATCTATMSNPTPGDSGDETVNVTSNVPNAPVLVTKHYKTTTTADSGTTDGGGAASITFDIGSPTIGYTVEVDVSINSGQATCSTSFTPQ